MTDLTTTHLQHLLDRTTPGPWEALDLYSDGAPRPDTTREMRAAGEYLGIMHAPNAELAALSPDLADEILRMRKELIAWADDEAQAHNALVKQAQEAGGAGIITTHKTIYNRILDILGDHDDQL
ncbi:hypothetical protein [Corynebacterium striatum]|uniref:hypothetical protein n=1 Tax=Corynebacterium striatum TaxID=43770 RepID=UPI000C54AB6B|nr:hypothetical protein [Corynebacterium striatum]PIS66261.1 hypothetical protein AZH46_04010 [Corynebacterium striatum]PXY04625.1 hypothetical protein CKF53_09355 [Corynebacterium striatum]PXY09169.1 hypothetical protein CKF53_00210 [Corynebacterium striatum]PXY12782.1 hypothetical protein CKF74_07270 [Corynebacterium striatum]